MLWSMDGYPTLQQLEDEGLVVSESRDGKRVYRLTPEGGAELEREAEAVREIWGRAERWEEWSHWMGPEVVLIAGPLAVLTKEALRALRAAGDSTDRQTRIREILECARKELEEFVRASRGSSKD